MNTNRHHGSHLNISVNAPVTLGFALLCLAAYVLNFLTGGWANRTLFSVYRASPLNPLTYLRCIGHVIGHSSWSHLLGNMMYILLLGPALEERYGGKSLLVVMGSTAVITGLMQIIFFPTTSLLGASGIVFAFILLTSMAGVTDGGGIPLTFVLVAVLYIGQELYSAFFVADSISRMAHIVGGLVGSGMGFLMNNIQLTRRH